MLIPSRPPSVSPKTARAEPLTALRTRSASLMFTPSPAAEARPPLTGSTSRSALSRSRTPWRVMGKVIVSGMLIAPFLWPRRPHEGKPRAAPSGKRATPMPPAAVPPRPSIEDDGFALVDEDPVLDVPADCPRQHDL